MSTIRSDNLDFRFSWNNLASELDTPWNRKYPGLFQQVVVYGIQALRPLDESGAILETLIQMVEKI